MMQFSLAHLMNRHAEDAAATQEKIWHRSYDPGVPKQIEFEDLSIPQLLENSAAGFPDSPAILFVNSSLTYKELKREVDRFAAALSDLGVKKDSRVAIHLPNLPQTVISFLATVKLGAQAVMTNPLYTPPEIEHQWNDAGCELAITTDFLYDQKLKDIRDKLPVRNFIIASIADYLRFPIKQLAPIKLGKADPPLIAKVAPGPGIHFFRKLIRSTMSSVPEVPINLDDVALLQYTGGTTGVAKGAMLTHRNLSSNVQQTRAWFPALEEGRERFLGVLPYFHAFGLTTSFLLPLYVGAAVVLIPNPRDISTIIKNTSQHRVTVFPGVPAMFNAINQHPGIEKIDIRSVKMCISGSAPLPPAVLERFEELTGSRIIEGFGLTEASPVTHVNPLNGVRKVGSIGLPLPNTEAKIVDPETGLRRELWLVGSIPMCLRQWFRFLREKEFPPGEEGELIIRGPQVMKGYWKMPDETSEVIRDGWLYTGDLATMDEDGYFTIVGRKKDMILASGYNIYPDEIDRLLMAHPAVLETCTIGVPDPKRGETVKSFIVLKPGMSTAAEEIQRFCRQNLAAYKVPRLVEFREKLPKSSVLKLLRRVLRDEELAKIQAGNQKQQDLIVQDHLTAKERSVSKAKKSVGLRDLQFKAVKMTFRLLGQVLPGLAARLVRRRFLSPRRYRHTDRERDLVRTGTPLRIPFRGLDLSATAWGQGPTVLLVHGWAGRGAQLGAFVKPLVEKGLRVVAIDGPAHGASPGRRTNLIEFADALIAAWGAVGPVYGIIAHSFGGTATAVALDRGLQARRVVLIASPSSPREVLGRFATFLGLPKRVVKRFSALIEKEVGVSMDELVMAHIAPRLQVPVLIFHDPADRDVPFDDGVAIAQAWPGAQLRAVEGRGHRRILRAKEVVQEAVTFLTGAEPEHTGDNVVSFTDALTTRSAA